MYKEYFISVIIVTWSLLIGYFLYILKKGKKIGENVNEP